MTVWLLVFAGSCVYCGLAGVGLAPHPWWVAAPVVVAGAVALGMMSAPRG